jgi:hypothetical protein
VGYKLLEHVSDLQSLEARNTDISDRILVFVSHFKTLEWLCLKRTAITDEGLKYLQGLLNLRHLDLVGTGVCGRGLAYLRNLGSSANFTFLVFSIMTSGPNCFVVNYLMQHLLELIRGVELRRPDP